MSLSSYPIIETRAITGGAVPMLMCRFAAALDPIGGLLGARESPATAPDTLGWLGVGTGALAGIEGTGSNGAGLARHTTGAGVRVVEAARQDRRRQKKSNSDYPHRYCYHAS